MVAPTRHTPMRTCVGCRTTAPQAELLRIAVVGDAPVADPRRRAGGRGVYVHQRGACLAAAGRGGLARALRRSVSRAQLDAIAGIAGAGSLSSGTPSRGPNDASQGRANAVERAPHLVHEGPAGRSHGA